MHPQEWLKFCLSFFFDILSLIMIKIITEYTNKFAQKKDKTVVFKNEEILSLIGCLYFVGVFWSGILFRKMSMVRE